MMPWEVLDDPRDPLPRECCAICLRHWLRCRCDPDEAARELTDDEEDR